MAGIDFGAEIRLLVFSSEYFWPFFALGNPYVESTTVLSDKYGIQQEWSIPVYLTANPSYICVCLPKWFLLGVLRMHN